MRNLQNLSAPLFEWLSHFRVDEGLVLAQDVVLVHLTLIFSSLFFKISISPTFTTSPISSPKSSNISLITSHSFTSPLSVLFSMQSRFTFLFDALTTITAITHFNVTVTRAHNATDKTKRFQNLFYCDYETKILRHFKCHRTILFMNNNLGRKELWKNSDYTQKTHKITAYLQNKKCTEEDESNRSSRFSSERNRPSSLLFCEKILHFLDDSTKLARFVVLWGSLRVSGRSEETNSNLRDLDSERSIERLMISLARKIREPSLQCLNSGGLCFSWILFRADQS